ncbi:MAG: hypothetical protein ABG776_01190 [Cyanobacteria bacterium J06555_13]
MAHPHNNDGEPTLAFYLALTFFIGLWLLIGVGVQGVLKIITPSSKKSTLHPSVTAEQIALSSPTVSSRLL